MKLLFIALTILISAGCVNQASTANETGKMPPPTPTVAAHSNSNASDQYSYSEYKYDQKLLDTLNAENESFTQIPPEFKSVDFKNFKYDFGQLKDGEFEKEYSQKYAQGGVTYSLGSVFYVDLADDAKKEAVVFINRLSCGGSCDGGAEIIYFYSSRKGKPLLIDILQTGSNSSGCSLKSLIINDKKINVEQFGRCLKDNKFDSDRPNICKFCVKDETRSVYSITRKGLKRESADIFETYVVNVMNSPAFISISE